MSKAMIIRNATITSMDPEVGVLPKGDILIQDGLISDINPVLKPVKPATGFP